MRNANRWINISTTSISARANTSSATSAEVRLQVDGFAGEIAGVQGAVPVRPVLESDFLEARECHGHDMSVAALLTPFADAVGAPVAADVGLGGGVDAGSGVGVGRSLA